MDRGVAQLGLERLVWVQEAEGSNPFTPIGCLYRQSRLVAIPRFWPRKCGFRLDPPVLSATTNYRRLRRFCATRYGLSEILFPDLKVGFFGGPTMNTVRRCSSRRGTPRIGDLARRYCVDRFDSQSWSLYERRTILNSLNIKPVLKKCGNLTLSRRNFSHNSCTTKIWRLKGGICQYRFRTG